jgi:hypothetical protein
LLYFSIVFWKKYHQKFGIKKNTKQQYMPRGKILNESSMMNKRVCKTLCLKEEKLDDSGA